MRSLLLLALFITCDGRNAVKRVPYIMGGSHITITGIQFEEKAQIKCLVRFPDGRSSIELEPSVPRDRHSAICRLPADIDSGSVDLEITAINDKTTTKKVMHSETFIIEPSPFAEVEVATNWTTNELFFTWDPEYFRQFFKPGASIMIQATLFIADSTEPVFTSSGIVMLAGANEGTAKVSITDANKDKISKLSHPYYYVLRPVGTQSNVYLSSVLFKSTGA